MMEWVVVWLLFGFIAGVVSLFHDLKVEGYVTVGDVLGSFILFPLMGFIGASFVLYHEIEDRFKTGWLDKKVFVKKKVL